MGNSSGSLCTTPQQSFVESAGLFQLEEIRYFMLEGSVNVNEAVNGVTALGNACYNNCKDIVKFLCDEPGVDVNASSLIKPSHPCARLQFSTFQSPLYAACRFKNKDCVAELMKHRDIDPNKGCYDADKSSGNDDLDLVESPLGAVCRLGDARSANYILKSYDLNPNIGGKYGSPLRAALMNRYTAIAEYILQHPKTNIHADDAKFPETPILTLLVNIDAVRVELVEKCLSRGELDLEGANSAGPLIRSVIGRRRDLLDVLLIQPQIDVNACVRLSSLKAETLVIRGQKIEQDAGVEDYSRYQNVLHYACSTLNLDEKHTMEILDILLKHPKIDVNSRERESDRIEECWGATPFFIAAKRNMVEFCKKIVDIGGKKVDVDACCEVVEKSGEKRKCTAFEVTTNKTIKKMIAFHREL